MNKIHDIKTLGKYLRDLRKSQGLTQEQLSATCGVGVRFIRELEHGKKTCQIGKAIHVLQMTGLDVYTAKRNFVQGNQTVTER